MKYQFAIRSYETVSKGFHKLNLSIQINGDEVNPENTVTLADGTTVQDPMFFTFVATKDILASDGSIVQAADDLESIKTAAVIAGKEIATRVEHTSKSQAKATQTNVQVFDQDTLAEVATP